MTETKKQEKVLDKTKKKERHNLVLWNDDVNSFDWVIKSLIEICKHEYTQAEQCALIVHNKGKASVKSGEKEELLKLKREFDKRKISTTVE
jgi:ATP-dependent Clp protease adaptor protein ClpS